MHITTSIDNLHPLYPPGLAVLGERAPVVLYLIGDPALLRIPALALFSSVKCPGSVILRTYDLAVALRDARVPVIGGFHSPMERECLAILLRGAQPVIVCLARSVQSMRVPVAWRAPISEGRLLLVSPFPPSLARHTAESAHKRNIIVAALAARIFVAHASPGGRIEKLCETVKKWGKPIFTFADIAPASPLHAITLLSR